MDAEVEKKITTNHKHRVSSELASLDTGMHVEGLSSVSASEEEEATPTKRVDKKKKSTPTPPKQEKRKRSVARPVDNDTPSKLAPSKKTKKPKKIVKEDDSEGSEDPQHPAPSKKKHQPPTTPQSSGKKTKRKVEEMSNVTSPVKNSKKSPSSASKRPPVLDSVERVVERLGMLHIKIDEKQLTMLKQTLPHLYQELVEIMNVSTVRGVIFNFMCTTPISRIFTYSDSDKTFHSIFYEKHDLVTLVDYDLEKSLDVAKTVSELSAEDRAEALAYLREGEENFDEENVQSEQWLNALIHLNIVEISPTKPEHHDKAENCLLHYATFKKTYWLSSATGRARLGRAVTTRYREVENQEKNRVAAETLLAKRAELIAFAERYIKPLSVGSVAAVSKRGAAVVATPPKKKKKAVVEEEEEEEAIMITPPKKKKATPPRPKKKVVVEEEEEDEEEEVAPLPKKKKTSTTNNKNNNNNRKVLPAVKDVVMQDESQEKKPTKTLEQKVKENVSLVLTQKLPQKEKVASYSSSSSESSSTSEDIFSFSDEEEKGREMYSADTLYAVQQIKKKQKLGLCKPNPDPNATSLLKTIEVKKNIEDSIKFRKVILDQHHSHPDVSWFRQEAK